MTFVIGESLLSLAFGESAFAYTRLVSSVFLGPAALSPQYPLLAASIVGTFTIILGSVLIGALASYLFVRFGRLGVGLVGVIAAGAAGGTLVWAITILAVGSAFLPQTVVVDPVWRGFLGHTLLLGVVFGGLLGRGRRAGR